jgi:hypothetical protein
MFANVDDTIAGGSERVFRGHAFTSVADCACRSRRGSREAPLQEALTHSPKDIRFAALAHVLAKAAVAGELEDADALRVIRHERRQRWKKKSLLAPRRSKAAQAVIDRHAEAGTAIPQNGSPDALHCDHVFALGPADLRRLARPEAWLDDLGRLDTVVCVTAAENYRIEQVEKKGVDGWTKYATAEVALTEPVPTSPPDPR